MAEQRIGQLNTGRKTDGNLKKFKPTTGYDLNGKRVLMAGYGDHKAVAEEVVLAHNGNELCLYDEKTRGKGIQTNLSKAITHADIVLIMLNSVSHNTANHAISIAREQHKLVAATNMNSPLAIEQAISRAINHQPIYVPSHHIVE
ncbi:DUF2325 domain-containing protein [Lentilactobacillus sp. SPB1-3]|uniref:DUF2325 domain-containing protein n=1 Tax=Lentilactobacillus terminaliae TaxID=3003483 RepID=A0ACD5DET5_9LACO|nr:DUF2325 domain-containing protein [Lentilactobacillus sp. SPB1-3]MCZ0977632.1 DUF2325 domain-containing protein [Lentilactobacillus sp. SPB1-3]